MKDNKIINSALLVPKSSLISLKNNKIRSDSNKIEEEVKFIKLSSPIGETQTYVHSASIFFQFAAAYSFQLNLKKKLEYASQGHFIELILKGIGFRGFVFNQNLFLQLGFSHLIVYEVPKDIIVKCKKAKLVLFGLNKNRVTQIAAEIRSLRIPDIYKGKGILYNGEQLKLKTGKQR